MIGDAQNRFSDAQAITAQAISEDVIDLGAERRFGTGENLYIHVNVDVAFTDVGSDSTLTVELVSDDNDGMSSPTVMQTIGTFGALSAVGSRLIARIQPELLNERFVALRYTPNNGDLTTGSVTALIVHGIDAETAYPDNITISP